MKQRIVAMRFILVLMAMVFIAFIAYKFIGVGLGNQANASHSNGKTATTTDATRNELSVPRAGASQGLGGAVLPLGVNPARDQWTALTKAVVASQNWAQTVATLKEHPDANRWLVIMSFQTVCSNAHTTPLMQEHLSPLFGILRVPSSERLHNARMLREVRERCADLDDFSKRTAWRRLPEVTSVPMGISPGFWDGYYKTGMTDAQSEATDKIVRTPEQLSQWLTSLSLEKIPANLRPEYFKQLKPFDYMGDDGEFSAVNWLITCELGDGCGNSTIHRYQACITAYYCSGNSVFESIETRHGAERTQVIRNVANLFLADLSKRGVDVFGFPKKKTP